MPLNYQWQHLKINQKSIKEFINRFIIEWKPKYISFDTETTGIHLTQDVPFYLSLSFIGDNGDAISGGLFIDSIDKEDLDYLMHLVFLQTSNGFLIGHNIPFDLNMMHNIGYICPHRNVLDTMVLIRLTTDAIQEKHGGAPLGLKRFASQYIDANAKAYEKQISQERTKLAKQFNAELYKLVDKDEFNHATQFPNDIRDLPPRVFEGYTKWLESLPDSVRKNMTSPIILSKEIPYSLVDKGILETYGIYDSIYTYEIFDRTFPLIKKRSQEKVFKIEQQLTYPLYKMSREGFTINKEYVFETQQIMKNYIIKRKRRFEELAGKNITVSQSKELLKILQDKFGLSVTSTNEFTLLEAQKALKREKIKPIAVEFIDLIFELRTLSKWYSTYLMKFVVTAKHYDKIHAQINPAGAVTGRFTSDFQQFPRDGVRDIDGNLLFHPRHMVQRPDDNHYLLFIDYSQMELRIQALYTILLDNPDTNLCQAYMPYLCYHYQTKEEFDYTNEKHLTRWNERKEDGTSAWHLKENDEPWVAVDLHAQMTANAFPDVPRDTDEFKALRKNVGKHANFACNYGAKAKRIHEMFPDMTWGEAKGIYEAYRTTFPGTVYYHGWCYDTTAKYGFGENLFSRRYYNMSGHNYLNAAIQGTGADLLKIKMIELYNFLEPYKTKLIMTVHDELIFVLHRDETSLIPKLKEIMETLEGTFVPIVVDAEISKTTWAEKKGFNLNYGLLTIDN